MPQLRDITVKIHTPFAIRGVPEVALPSDTDTLQGNLEENPTRTTKAVLIPALSRSIFWISYFAKEPANEYFLVFKLFVGQKHLITWSCGKEQEWKGKVQFILFNTDKIKGAGGMEKRVLQFGEIRPSANKDSGFEQQDAQYLEVKVYRANVKARIPRQLEYYGGGSESSQDIQFLQAGQTKRGQSRKFYSFGLIDALNEPHLAFRFHCRTYGKHKAKGNRCQDSPRLTPVPAEVEAIDPSIAKIYTDQPVRTFISPEFKPNLPPIPRTAKSVPRRRLSRSSQTVQRLSIPGNPTAPPVPILSEAKAIIPRDSGDNTHQCLSVPPSAIFRPPFDDKPLPPTPSKKTATGSANRPEAPVSVQKGGRGSFWAVVGNALSRKDNLGDTMA